MTLDQNVRLFRKWWWLIILAAVLAGGVGYLLRSRQAPSYQATAILAFGNVIGNTNPDSGNFVIGSNLSQTYSELVKTNTIIDNTLSALHLPISADALRTAVDYKVIPNAALLQIIVTYNDAVLSAAIANEVVDQLLLNAPADISPDQQQQVQQINEQITKLNTEIIDAEQRLTTINNNLQTAQTALDISDLTAQRAVAVEQITSLQSTLAQFENTLTQLQGRRTPVEVYERASVPGGALSNGALQSGLLAAAVAVSLTIGVVLLVTYFDNSNIHTPDEISKALDLPVLGTISRYGNDHDSYREKLITRQPLRVEVLETYRLLFIRLTMSSQRSITARSAPPMMPQLASGARLESGRGFEAANQTILVSSPAPGDGKSVVSANLAVTAALFGLRVLLIDADLHQPTLHKFFGLPNDIGLTSLVANAPFIAGFSAHTSSAEIISLAPELIRTADEFIQQTDLANLSLITTGPVSEAAVKGLSLVFQPQWLAILKECVAADMVIIDSPPCLAVADSSVLAAKTGARVVLVLSAGRTSIRTAIKAKEQFVKVSANLEGVVLNMVDGTDVEFDYKDYGAQKTPSKK